MLAENIEVLKPKDFASDQDVRWCPGCGDYAILKQVQVILPELNIPRENIVFVSGIGCSSRFPYYMNTFGVHTIHGRAAAIVTGLKLARPELSVWMVTGDGDSMSIGANHFIQMLRRNINVNVLLFNNEIYGLTKGQYSPTSKLGIQTKSTPYGSVERSLNPVALALGSEATFIARTLDRDIPHLRETLRQTNAHKGTSLLEIYQNCIIFNDKVFESFSDKKLKLENDLFLEDKKPLIFGQSGNKGIKLDGLKPVIVEIGENGVSKDDLWIHDKSDKIKATILANFFEMPDSPNFLPRPFGIFYQVDEMIYEDEIVNQLDEITSRKGKGDLDKILKGTETWIVD